MSLISSNRNGEVFVDDGFMFLFDAFISDGSKRFWRCRYKRECKARVHTCKTDLIILKRINTHTHDSDVAKVEANIAVCNIKKSARETMEPTSTVINECISGLSEASKVLIRNCIIFLNFSF